MIKSEYKGVRYQTKKTSSNAKKWICQFKGKSASFATEGEAAKNYDLLLIRDNKPPVNILKKIDVRH